MGCGAEISDWDDKAVQDSMAGKNTNLDPKMLAEVMPQVKAAIKQRCIDCLKENVENAKNELTGRRSQEGQDFTDIEKLDLNVEPTEKEYQEMYRVGGELGMTKDLEIIDMPAITGIKDPEEIITQAETMRAIEKGEIKLGDADRLLNQVEQRDQKNRIDVETMRGLMKETLDFLRNSKIPYEFRNQSAVNMVVFVGQQEPGQTKGKIAVGKAVPSVILQAQPERSRNIYVFRDKTGQFFRGGDLHWVLAHEIFHISQAKTDSLFREDFLEWQKASISQMTKGVVGDKDYTLSDQAEFRAQHFAAWVTNSPKLCPEMKDFFDRHFKE